MVRYTTIEHQIIALLNVLSNTWKAINTKKTNNLSHLSKLIVLKSVLFTVILLAGSLVFAQESLIQVSNTPEKTVEVGKQIQITADLTNNQDIEQDFAYIVQIQNEDGVTVSLAWLTGTLSPAQSFSPAISWIPQQIGIYEATIFVWESIDNPSALSPTLTLKINVGQNA